MSDPIVLKHHSGASPPPGLGMTRMSRATSLRSALLTRDLSSVSARLPADIPVVQVVFGTCLEIVENPGNRDPRRVPQYVG